MLDRTLYHHSRALKNLIGIYRKKVIIRTFAWKFFYYMQKLLETISNELFERFPQFQVIKKIIVFECSIFVTCHDSSYDFKLSQKLTDFV